MFRIFFIQYKFNKKNFLKWGLNEIFIANS